MRVSRSWAIAALVCVWAGSSGPAAMGQGTVVPEKRDQAGGQKQILPTAEGETQKGMILSYRQAYRSNHQPVRLDGTLFVVMNGFETKDCMIRIQISATDTYYGSIGRKAIPGTQVVHRARAEFRLGRAITASAHVVEKRPAQLNGGTHPACEERTECTIPWLEIQTDRPVIKVENTTNDIEGYDGFVKNAEGYTTRFDIPVSSVEAGKAMARELREMALRCGE